LVIFTAQWCILVHFGFEKNGSCNDAKYTQLAVKFAKAESAKVAVLAASVVATAMD